MSSSACLANEARQAVTGTQPMFLKGEAQDDKAEKTYRRGYRKSGGAEGQDPKAGEV